MLSEFRPDKSNYSFKHAGYTFDYSRVVALNLRWSRLPDGGQVRCRVKRVEALAESDAALQNPRITLGGATLPIPATLHTGHYAEFRGGDQLHIYSESGNSKQSLKLDAPPPVLPPGAMPFRIDSDTSASIKWTQITHGEPVIQASAGDMSNSAQ
jgi:hypothetical protein